MTAQNLPLLAGLPLDRRDSTPPGHEASCKVVAAPRLESGIISIDHVLAMEDVLRYDALHHTSRLGDFQERRNLIWIRKNDDNHCQYCDDDDDDDDLSSSETMLH